MKTISRIISTIALATATVAISASTATAVIQPPVGDPSFIWGCASAAGQILDIGEDLEGPYEHRVVTYSISPCGTPNPLTVFAIAAYNTDGTAYGEPHVYPPAPSTGASIVLLRPDTTATCLITRPDVRIACVAVDHGRITPLPTDAPQVSYPAIVDLTNRPTSDPRCPPCW